jgi:thymidylate synthase
MVYQFHVNSRSELDCLLFQRSADLFLGAPFNFVGAAALVHMLAQQCGLRPGRLIWTGGDVHLYVNHLDAVATQLARAPRPWPRLRLIRTPASIDDYRIEDFEVSGYDPCDAIAAEVAV